MDQNQLYHGYAKPMLYALVIIGVAFIVLAFFNLGKTDMFAIAMLGPFAEGAVLLIGVLLLKHRAIKSTTTACLIAIICTIAIMAMIYWILSRM